MEYADEVLALRTQGPAGHRLWTRRDYGLFMIEGVVVV